MDGRWGIGGCDRGEQRGSGGHAGWPSWAGASVQSGGMQGREKGGRGGHNNGWGEPSLQHRAVPALGQQWEGGCGEKRDWEGYGRAGGGSYDSVDWRGAREHRGNERDTTWMGSGGGYVTWGDGRGPDGGRGYGGGAVWECARGHGGGERGWRGGGGGVGGPSRCGGRGEIREEGGRWS